METTLCDYPKNSARMHVGLTPYEVRRLAYELVMKKKLKLPYNWMEHSSAGEDWLKDFLNRHKNDVALRLPEATSSAQASSFKETSETRFYDNLNTVRERYIFEAKDIWNIDETGCTTIQLFPIRSLILANCDRIAFGLLN